MTRRRSTYSMPGSSGSDDFRAKQEPAFEPVDDLSRFMLDRIREAETEPVADGVDAFKSPGDAAAYREPDCAHDARPASTCTICRDDPPLRKWKQSWAAWLAENPGSDEVRNGYVAWMADR